MSEVRILAIETASAACSAALLIGERVEQRYELAPRRHMALILPFVDALLAEAGLPAAALDAVAFGRGPGSFTGLRIAAGVAQGIAFGADLPVVPVSTLAALAQGTVREQGARAVLAALDARMSEVYWGAFVSTAQARVQLLGAESVCAPDAVPAPEGGHDWSAAGEGWGSYREALEARLGVTPRRCHPQQMPQAHDVAVLAAAELAAGRALPPEQATPVYLRDRVADKPRPKA